MSRYIFTHTKISQNNDLDKWIDLIRDRSLFTGKEGGFQNGRGGGGQIKFYPIKMDSRGWRQDGWGTKVSTLFKEEYKKFYPVLRSGGEAAKSTGPAIFSLRPSHPLPIINDRFLVRPPLKGVSC